MRDKLLKNLWRWKCGLSEDAEEPKKQFTLKEIQESQSNHTFEKLRVNRMVMGFFRYGSILGNKKKFDNIGSAIARLEKYRKTGNGEHLVDVANLCMVEFTQENHKDYHFESEDDSYHTKEI